MCLTFLILIFIYLVLRLELGASHILTLAWGLFPAMFGGHSVQRVYPDPPACKTFFIESPQARDISGAQSWYWAGSNGPKQTF